MSLKDQIKAQDPQGFARIEALRERLNEVRNRMKDLHSDAGWMRWKHISNEERQLLAELTDELLKQYDR